MNKGQLVHELSRRCDCTQQQADLILTAFCEIVSSAVADGEKVTLVGFGTFEARERSAREGRNPSTGEPITIPAKTIPFFSAGKGFKDKVAA